MSTQAKAAPPVEPCSLFQGVKNLIRQANPTIPAEIAKVALRPAMYASRTPFMSLGNAARICVAAVAITAIGSTSGAVGVNFLSIVFTKA
ncbi:uncharacterized protein N7473_008868 [Penicillium subrubescens]|uniref:Uncharacterized protein n=1 Tax=Penicillium subrubescens TaxID=1316194 RepID=A0A1Q5U750_9EURO|nr:uncharacterized protein N7473_008868 [Penicillium subrubescens]KAJ5886194.1 hypothetical protein N7473_008868 [Penicillium subrubescens]OKP08309.1 hypothetical protein PENSUB_5676 [Penicillium subrubescens]